MQILTTTIVGKLQDDTWAIQTDDGTIFYWRTSLPNALFVKWKGREIHATLQENTFNCDGACGDAVYLTSNRQIYKATFNPTDGILVTHLRQQLENEKARWEFYSTVIGGQKFVYRLCDDPSKGNLINVSDDRLNGLYLRILHRGKVIYFSKNHNAIIPSVRTIGEHAIVIEANDLYPLIVRDYSRFLYMTDGTIIHTLDLTSMEFLPDLNTSNLAILSFVGVKSGILTFIGMNNDGKHLFEAQLPKYYEQETSNDGDLIDLVDEPKISSPVSSPPTAPDVDAQFITIHTAVDNMRLMMNKILERNRAIEKIDEMHAIEKAELEDKTAKQQAMIAEITMDNERFRLTKEDNKEENELNEHIAELRHQICTMTLENEEMHKKINQLSLVKEENNELIKNNTELRNQIGAMTLNNEEIQKENDQLRFFKEENNELIENLANLKHQIGVINLKNEEMQKEIEQLLLLKEENNELNNNITELRHQIHIMALENDEMQKENDELRLFREENSELNKNIAELRHQIRVLTLEKDQIQTESQEMKEELENLRNDMEKIEKSDDEDEDEDEDTEAQHNTINELRDVIARLKEMDRTQKLSVNNNLIGSLSKVLASASVNRTKIGRSERMKLAEVPELPETSPVPCDPRENEDDLILAAMQRKRFNQVQSGDINTF
ncbi:hypothetical protein PMAYCL1PPCAC_08026 [Pristionchus mayeri]|uniref:Uncharacterized protein n=1 Tax=Pristionchus mayeri TaxID=1317129 RepID=A0AAN4ZBT3_9BILA|nr:hypothetical protein PMAYCL1PPCAC_08026 [Pristionchus mayeri]